MRANVVASLLIGAALGCASEPSSEPARAAEPQPPAASEGDEITPEPPPERQSAVEVPAAAEPEPASGPGTLTLTAIVGSDPVPAKVRVLDDSGATVAEGTSGSPLRLPSGQYQLSVEITDPAVMADTPAEVRDLVLRAGQEAKLEARFRYAKVRLDVIAGGRSQPGTKVRLLRNGEPVAEMKSGAEPVAITPGRYEADVYLRGTTIRVQGLQFPDSATQTVPVRVQY